MAEGDTSRATDPLIIDEDGSLQQVTSDGDVSRNNQEPKFSVISKRFLLSSQITDTNLEQRIKNIATKDVDNFRKNSDSLYQLITIGVPYIDLKWYGWEAIHYAAYSCEPEKLETLISTLDPSKINTLTNLSENALHILLEHGRVAKSFNVSCQNGQESKLSKIINQEQDHVLKCAEFLINKKIDVNHSNFWNETPILIAIKRKYYRIVRLLCQVKGIDLDSCKDPVLGKTARELLKEKNLPKHVSSACTKKDLFHLLKSGDEDAFVKFNGGKIKDFVNSFDGDNKTNSSCALLQYCFRRGRISWCQENKSKHESDYYEDITANHLVQIFCQNGMARCIQHLLKNGADVDFTLPKFECNRTLLEVAIEKSYYPLVALILERESAILEDIKIENLCIAMTELLNSSDNNTNTTINLVLTKLSMEPTHFSSSKVVDNLMKLLENGVKKLDKENILLLLKVPGSLCRTKNVKETQKSILEEIDPEILKSHLDDCVEQKNDGIHINYDSFITENSVQKVLEVFLESPNLMNFFRHPTFKILIVKKWDQLHLQKWPKMKYFTLNLLFHVMFYVSLNAYILLKFNNVPCLPLLILCIVFWLIFVLKEGFQMFADCFGYWKEKNNYVEIVFIIFTFMVFVSQSEWCDTFAVISVLSSNLVLLLLLQQVPRLAKYIIILQTIVFYLRYIIFYFVQFLAFAICFYILFAKSDQVFYIDLPNKIFETVILFSGNLDYMDTPWKETNSTANNLYHNFEYKELFSKIVFILFVLFLAIILQNLLLGLLVTDMSNLHETVKLYEQKARAGFVIRLEIFLKCLPQYFAYDKKVNSKDVIVSDEDRRVLDDEEKQILDHILTKKAKRTNNLKHLCSHIRMKIRERTCDNKYDINKDLMEKLEFIEERLKNWNGAK